MHTRCRDLTGLRHSPCRARRIKQIVTLTNTAPTNLMGGTTWYLHGNNNSLLYEKEIKANGVTEQRHYVQAAGMTFALAVVRTGAGVSSTAPDRKMRPTQLEYFQQDNLGSIVAIADETGTVIERLAYDPWGKRRYANGLPDKADSLVGVNTDRGYTLHEHLDEVGVIHMNGRVYDPLIGRFMSADPFIQSPGNLQSYNRYAYVWNNPLAMTDPSGYFSLRGFFRSIDNFRRDIIRETGKAINTVLEPLPGWAKGVAIGLASVAACGPGAPACAAAMTATATGASAYGAGASSSDAFRAGAIAGGTAYAYSLAGDVYANDPAAGYAAHAGVGCASSMVSGGNCAQGAAAAVFGKYTTVTIGGTPGQFNGYQMVATMVAGGVGSVIAGGKFENGAKAAAFGYLFNHLSQHENTTAGRLTAALSQLAPGEIPPGVDVNANIERSQSMSGREYYDAVKSGGEWDYKRFGAQYEDFGNFNFGATCGSQASFLCSPGAGVYQVYSGTSQWSYWKSFFDDPKDQYWINQGQQYYNRYQSEFMWWAQPVRKIKGR